MPYGRGGAGNIAPISDPAKRSSDAENSAKLQKDAETLSSTDEYAHSGRGGAGNWFSPTTLATAGQFASSNKAITSSSSSSQQPSGSPNTRLALVPAEQPSRQVGRGGAGNFVWETEAEQKAKADAIEKAYRIHDRVLKDVEAQIAKPGRAILKADGLKE